MDDIRHCPVKYHNTVSCCPKSNNIHLFDGFGQAKFRFPDLMSQQSVLRPTHISRLGSLILTTGGAIKKYRSSISVAVRTMGLLALRLL
jgi:hypothetical protein